MVIMPNGFMHVLGHQLGKGNRNVFSNHQIALWSIFKNLVKWQEDLKILPNGNKIFKNLVKWQQDFYKARQMATRSFLTTR